MRIRDVRKWIVNVSRMVYGGITKFSKNRSNCNMFDVAEFGVCSVYRFLVIKTFLSDGQKWPRGLNGVNGAVFREITFPSSTL